MTKRATPQSGETRKTQILNATLQILGENGINELTTAKIAKKVGIAESTIFKHFSSKMDILQTLTETFTIQLVDVVENIKNENACAYNKLIKLFGVNLDMLEKNQGLPRFIFADTLHVTDPLIRKTIRDTISKYTQIVQTIIEQGIKENAFKKNLQTKPAADLFLSVVQHTVLQHFANGFKDKKSDKELILSLLSLFSVK